MDFSLVTLTPEHRRFARDVDDVLDDLITADVLEHERLTGDGYHPGVHRALGHRGWLMPTWAVEDGGAGLDRIEARILDLALQRHHAPMMLATTTVGAWPAVAEHARPEMLPQLRAGVADGSARFCLGYSEPDGGSDIAAAQLRAVRTAEGWLLNGAKMWTTGAHNATHVFLLTRSNVHASKHRGLTMFLVPMDSPGIEVQPIHTYGGERTNATYFGDVLVDDRWRLGEVDAGWAVLMGPLIDEHGTGTDADPLVDLSFGRHYLRPLQEALLDVVRWAQIPREPGEQCAWSDAAFRDAVARIAIDVEAAISAPGAAGRILGAETLARGAADLTDLLGAQGLLPIDAEGAVGGGSVEFAHRFAQGTLTYGGSVEVFRNMIAHGELGLPRQTFPDGS